MKRAVAIASIIAIFAYANIILFGSAPMEVFFLVYFLAPAVVVSYFIFRHGKGSRAILLLMAIMITFSLAFFAGSVKLLYDENEAFKDTGLQDEMQYISSTNEYYAGMADYLKANIAQYRNSSLMLQQQISTLSADTAILDDAIRSYQRTPIIREQPSYEQEDDEEYEFEEHWDEEEDDD